MEADAKTALTTLLGEAEVGHAEYEAQELGGVYDEAWPRWYATYAVEHGLAGILGHEVGTDRLTSFLTESYAQFAAADPKPDEPWAEYTAARILAEL